MDNRIVELLAYIRILYDRQDNKASRAGMTFWAILGGIIYVVWHLLQTLSGLEVNDSTLLDFYRSFGHVYLAILSISVLITFGRNSNSKRNLDYRIFRDPDSNIAIFTILVLFFVIPLCVLVQASTSDVTPIISWQSTVNFWTVLVLLTISMGAFLYERLISLSSRFPPVAPLVSGTSISLKVVRILVALLFWEIFVGNVLNIVAEVYGSSVKVKIYIVAFDTSLLMIGCYLLFSSRQADDRLHKLACFERDILLHNLSEKEIVDRLQDDHLGRYLGDWIADVLREVKEKSDVLIKCYERSEELIKNVREINEEYEKERTGRVNDFLDELEEKNKSYIKSLEPLVIWLDKLSTYAELQKDTTMLAILKSSVAEIKASSEQTKTKVEAEILKLKDWIKELKQNNQ